MPRHSSVLPGKKPGVSTRVRIGRFMASHRSTKRAPFWLAAMSTVPASDSGWFATIPIACPSMRATAVTMFGAHWAQSSCTYPSSTTAAATLRTS
jgi:hypothetical protein